MAREYSKHATACAKIIKNDAQKIKVGTKKCHLYTTIRMLYRINQLDTRLASLCRAEVKREFFNLLIGNICKDFENGDADCLSSARSLQANLNNIDDWIWFTYIDKYHMVIERRKSAWVSFLYRLSHDVESDKIFINNQNMIS